MNKKKLLRVILNVAAIMLIAGLGITAYAYFTSNDSHQNIYVIENTDTEIEEEFEKISDTSYKKTPRIVNQGKIDTIIRMRVYLTPTSQSENVLIDGTKYSQWTPDSAVWKYNPADDFYYYQGILMPGASTQNLFQKVDIISLDEMEDFQIMIYQEGVQTMALDADGNRVFAYTEDATENKIYDDTGAGKIWEIYDNAQILHKALNSVEGE